MDRVSQARSVYYKTWSWYESEKWVPCKPRNHTPLTQLVNTWGKDEYKTWEAEYEMVQNRFIANYDTVLTRNFNLAVSLLQSLALSPQSN